MKTNKSLKTPDEDSLRGTGFSSMGYTESGKQVKNVKRLMTTFDDTPKTQTSKKNKTEVTCTRCHATFKTTSGKLPKHKGRWNFSFFRRNDNGTVDPPSYCEGVAVFKKKQKTIVYKDVTFGVGDAVLYTLQEYDPAKKSHEKKLKMVTYDAKIKSIVFTNEPHGAHYGGYDRYVIKFDNGNEYEISKILDMIKV